MRSVVVLTGAGVSADSGVRTFRDAGGLWEGHAVEDVATPEAWARDPRTVWRFYQERRAGLADVVPNPAHQALAAFEARLLSERVPFLLVTQNVDDLHERAGSRTLVHMHGALSTLACEACGATLEDRSSLDPGAFVPCADCGHARLRPDVVWFGEVPRSMERIERALGGVTHFLALGTSGAVYPAAGFLQVARAMGARTWVQSLDPPENLGAADRFRPGRAAEAVPALLREVELDLGLTSFDQGSSGNTASPT